MFHADDQQLLFSLCTEKSTPARHCRDTYIFSQAIDAAHLSSNRNALSEWLAYQDGQTARGEIDTVFQGMGVEGQT